MLDTVPAPPDWTFAPRTDTSWMADAACADLPPSRADALLFPGRPGVTTDWEPGRALCRTCPVQAACLDWALTTGEEYGMWGGLSEDERARLRVRLGLRDRPGGMAGVPTHDGVPADGLQHGTPWAYNRHRRRGEEPCRACRTAKRLYAAEQREAG